MLWKLWQKLQWWRLLKDIIRMLKNTLRFSPNLCLTHNCNLNCVYCYQNHDKQHRMSFETAVSSVDWIFRNKPENTTGVEISFIGGEPLLEFDLIKRIVEYIEQKYSNENYICYATTNGTLLNDERKKWLREHRDKIVLGLSIDGAPRSHNYNRCNSFDLIDIDFFKTTWPNQGVKMTISEYSLGHLAENLIFLHKLGFTDIGGVNLFEGEFDWDDEKYILTLIPQLKQLVSFYVENDHLKINQMLDKNIEMCAIPNKKKKKWCGIGVGTIFFDTDGKRYPCTFITPMTFNENELKQIEETDFKNESNFVDDDCFNNCYIYPVCPYCPAANFKITKSFCVRDKSKCRIQKLITLYSADLQAKRLLKNPSAFSQNKIPLIVESVKNIRKQILPEFKEYTDIL